MSSVLLLLLDDAVSAVRAANETFMPFARNTERVKADLISRGVDEAWEDESTVADVYFNRMSHAFGQGLWAEKPTLDGKDQNLAVDLFKFALRDVKAVVHSRSSNAVATLDNDDFYQFLGGSAIAARQVNSETPEVLVSDMRNSAGEGEE